MSGGISARNQFISWIASSAEALDTGDETASTLLPRLVDAGFAHAGVPQAFGGAGGDVRDAVSAIAEVAHNSVAASFTLWGHRTYIEFLLQTSNRALRELQLPTLLDGSVAGATGLSNAMKFLAGLEPLQINAAVETKNYILNGKMPWVTNLRPEGFHVAAAVDRLDGGPTMVVALSHDDTGVSRTADLSLMAMRSTNTAAIHISNTPIDKTRILADRASEWLPRVRPAFVGLQCGMSIGLARRSLMEATNASGSGRGVLSDPILDARSRLALAEKRLLAGLHSGEFEGNAAKLFELRIELAEIVSDAISFELQASGGRAYLSEPGKDFARRYREAAFIPVITPSLVQLKTALQKQRDAA